MTHWGFQVILIARKTSSFVKFSFDSEMAIEDRCTFVNCYARRARELSAELTVTHAYWSKKNAPVSGKILQGFRHACQKYSKILPHTGAFCLRQ
jgi:hypothetical protein